MPEKPQLLKPHLASFDTEEQWKLPPDNKAPRLIFNAKACGRSSFQTLLFGITFIGHNPYLLIIDKCWNADGLVNRDLWLLVYNKIK